MTTKAQAKYNSKPETKQAKHDWYVANKQRILEEERQKYATDSAFAEKKKANSNGRYYKQHDQIREQQHEYNHSPAGHTRKQVKDANGHYLRKYGYTTEEVDQMIADRNGLCDLCHKPAKIGRRLYVDHDHTTGKFRGMLCFNCNTGLGHLGDTAERLCQAAEYLERTA